MLENSKVSYILTTSPESERLNNLNFKSLQSVSRQHSQRADQQILLSSNRTTTGGITSKTQKESLPTSSSRTHLSVLAPNDLNIPGQLRTK